MRDIEPGRPLVFSHIPKTAGTSMRQSLVEALRPTRCVTGYDASLAGGYGVDGLRPPRPDRVFAAPEEIPADADLVLGHIAPSTTRTRFPDAEHVTFLRNPQVRILSQWLHGRAVTEWDIRRWGAFRDSFRQTWRPLPDYLRISRVAANTDNTITRFLVWPHPRVPDSGWIDERDDDGLFEAAVAELERMAHADVIENPGFADDLTRWLGRPLPGQRANARTWVPQRRHPDAQRDFGPRARRLLAHSTRIDVRLWKHLAGRVLPGQDLDEVLSAGVERAVGAYLSLGTQPPPASAKRRVAVAAYGARARLQHPSLGTGPDRAG
ncbi:MAG: hypothetical protein ACRDPH_01405 [Marmoricola sp.]